MSAAAAPSPASDSAGPPVVVHNDAGIVGVVAGREIQFILLVAVAISGMTSIPYLVAWKTSTHDKVFSGVLQHSLDVNNYLAYARQAKSGQWLFHNSMTGEPHADVFFNLEWLIIGKVASLLHVSLTAATDTLRVISIGLMCYAVYWLSAFFFAATFLRRVALIAIVCGGGFGWIAAAHLLGIRLDSSYFLDLSNANLFPFYWALKLPHFLISETFVVFGMCSFLRAESRRSTRWYASAGLFYLMAGACRPYDMIYLMLVTTLYLSWRVGVERSLADIFRRLLPVSMCLPFLGYYYWIFKIHSIFRWWTLPGRPAPELWRLLLAFGLTSVLTLFAVWKLPRTEINSNSGFILCGLATAAALSYSYHLFHFAFQFATNILVPAVILIMVFLQTNLLQVRKRSWGSALIAVFLLVNSFTSIALTGQTTLLAKHGEFQVDAKLLEAYSWLDKHSAAGDVVLADFGNSNMLPQYAHNPVFCGYPNAVRFDEKEKALGLFFSSKTENVYRQELLRQSSVYFLLLTATEQQQLFEFLHSSSVREIFRNDSVAIFYATFS